MPIYEYVCKSCGHELEALQKMSDAPLTDCPECSQPDLTKKVSAAGFRLSGGGWYETDFKSGEKKNIAGDKDKSKAESKPKTEKKTESTGSSGKTATKTSS